MSESSPTPTPEATAAPPPPPAEAALEIADLGLLSRQDRPEVAPGPRMLMAKASFASDSAGGAPPVQLQPEDIVISAAVEARFAAR